MVQISIEFHKKSYNNTSFLIYNLCKLKNICTFAAKIRNA